MRVLLLLLFTLTIVSFAQEEKIKLKIEKEEEILNYNNIKQALINDALEQAPSIRKKKIQKIKKEKKRILKEKYNYPTSADFWSLVSEYWLVKKAPVLKWDFIKPEYGIKQAFQILLEKLGLYNKRVKILIVNTPDITHIALPANEGEYIQLLSLPFIRTLDLTKVDLSLLLLEDMVRVDLQHFRSNLKQDISKLGTNFYGSKIDKTLVSNLLKEYDTIIFKEGFSFEQQFALTKRMDQLLKGYPLIWSDYVSLLNKIKNLIKEDLLYKSYNRIFPSPEMQIKWLSPKKKAQ